MLTKLVPMSENFTITIVANKINKSRGGSNFSLDLIARTLVKQGHEVNIVTLNFSSDNDLFPNREYNVYKRSVSKQSLLTFRPIVNVFNQWESQTDVYHVFSPLIAPYAGKYRQSGGSTPVFCRLNQYSMFCSNVAKMDGECHKKCSIFDRIQHSSDDIATRMLKSPLFAMQSNIFSDWANQVDQYYAISPNIKKIYSEFGINNDLIEVIPNFYDPNFRKEGISNGFKNNGKITVLYVGRLSNEKGVDTLVEAMKYTNSNVKLDIVGDGDQKDELEKKVFTNGLQESISFYGFVENSCLYKYYKRSDIFVHPAEWPEPFGRTLLEAMQYDCGLIVTNSGAPSWIVDQAGMVVPQRQPKELAIAINDMSELSNLKDYKEMSNSRINEFEPISIIAKMEECMYNLYSTKS